MCPDPPGKETVDHEGERLLKRERERERGREGERKRRLEFRSTGNEEC